MDQTVMDCAGKVRRDGAFPLSNRPAIKIKKFLINRYMVLKGAQGCDFAIVFPLEMSAALRGKHPIPNFIFKKNFHRCI